MTVDAAKLARIVANIEAIRDQKKELTKDERDEFEIAKDADIDGKALRRVLQRRAMGADARQQFDDLVDDYEHALGQKAVARDMAGKGASLSEIEKATGLTHGTAARATKAARTKTKILVQRDIPPHDADGVIHEPGPAQPAADDGPAGCHIATPTPSDADEAQDSGITIPTAAAASPVAAAGPADDESLPSAGSIHAAGPEVPAPTPAEQPADCPGGDRHVSSAQSAGAIIDHSLDIPAALRRKPAVPPVVAA